MPLNPLWKNLVFDRLTIPIEYDSLANAGAFSLNCAN
jgi:hypothetical protein